MIERVLSHTTAWKAFAVAVFLGGMLGAFAPASFLWFFGLPGGGSTDLFLELSAVGVMTAGLGLYLKFAVGGNFVRLESYIFAAFGAALVFLLNFKLGHPLGMALLVFFAVFVGLSALYIKYKP